jgi:hypothetical protein
MDEERDVARAKNTDRAEARRRYRAATGAEVESDSASVPTAAVPRDARPSGTPKAPAAPAPRPGIVEAFRRAAQPADIRSDLHALPVILRTERRVWLAPGLVLAGGVFLLVPALRESSIGILAAQLLVVPPPLIPSFLAGMLVSRGAWLVGLLVGLFSGIVFAVYVATAPASGSVAITDDLRSQALLYAITVSPLFGLATGAFAGFYRRFLRVASPQQQQRRSASKGQRPASKSGR